MGNKGVSYYDADIINLSTQGQESTKGWTALHEEMVRFTILTSRIGDSLRSGKTVFAISSSPRNQGECPDRLVNAIFNVATDMDKIVEACRHNIRFVTVYSQ